MKKISIIILLLFFGCYNNIIAQSKTGKDSAKVSFKKSSYGLISNAFDQDITGRSRPLLVILRDSSIKAGIFLDTLNGCILMETGKDTSHIKFLDVRSVVNYKRYKSPGVFGVMAIIDLLGFFIPYGNSSVEQGMKPDNATTVLSCLGILATSSYILTPFVEKRVETDFFDTDGIFSEEKFNNFSSEYLFGNRTLNKFNLFISNGIYYNNFFRDGLKNISSISNESIGESNKYFIKAIRVTYQFNKYFESGLTISDLGETSSLAVDDNKASKHTLHQSFTKTNYNLYFKLEPGIMRMFNNFVPSLSLAPGFSYLKYCLRAERYLLNTDGQLILNNKFSNEIKKFYFNLEIGAALEYYFSKELSLDFGYYFNIQPSINLPSIPFMRESSDTKLNVNYNYMIFGIGFHL